MQQQCGLCTALVDLFRRIMCIGDSRRGSGESYYRQFDQQQDRELLSSVDTTDPYTVHVRIPGPEAEGIRRSQSRRLSDCDWVLLQALDYRPPRHPRTSRFLTMHKRRRKRLATRSLSQESPALLDDIHHGIAQCLLDRVWQWPFNAFTLDNVTGGRSLPVMCVHLFHWYGLIEHFNLDAVRVWKLFTLVEEGYHSTNPYHNSIHATDVTQAMHCFLQEEKIRKHLTPLEIMSSLIAAVTHDLDHPGVNQPFLIATSNHLAALYENTSVLENHHWRSAMGCLLESHVMEDLEDVRGELEQQVSSLILATDITRQQEFLVKFKRYLDQNLLDMSQADFRHFILQIALKCADISNPCRPWEVSRKWSQKVCEEFYRQGDYERQLNLPVTSLCDRLTTSVPKIQAGFFRFVVAPLLEEWHRFLGTPLSESMMKHLRDNQVRWENLLQQELAEETRTEISEAEEIPDDEVDVAPVEEDDSYLESRRSSTNSVHLIEGIGRRHSVPLSINRTSGLSLTVIRRESLPVVDHKRRFTLGPIMHLEEEDEELQLSLTSSVSESISAVEREDRPVSAETLLPEPSIASITTSTEACRLSSVLHGTSLAPPARLGLTRQQTFPPLQPYVRARYMSTTSEVNLESSSTSSSTSSDKSRTGSDALKRDSNDDSSGEKAVKIAKLAQEKENVDPQFELDLEIASLKSRRNIPQGLARRRGSAPVGLLRADEPGHALSDRRGSVPSAVSVTHSGRRCSLSSRPLRHTPGHGHPILEFRLCAK